MRGISPPLFFRVSPRSRLTCRLHRFVCSLALLLVWWGSPAWSPGQVTGDGPTPSGGVPPSAETLPEIPSRPSSGSVGAHASRSPRRKHPERYDLNRIGDRGIGSGFNFYSLDREFAMGKEMAQEIDVQLRFVDDPQITEYVNRLVQNIVRHSDAKVPFSVKIVNDEEVNTFALPGGFLYVNSGLIIAADDEAALAGIVAHEIAHVAARHATKTLTKKTVFDLASLPLVFFGGAAVAIVSQAASVAVPMSFLKFSRDAEREADLLAIEYAYAAGYDPQAFVQFFEKLRTARKQKLAFVAGAFDTHPMTEDRIKRAQAEIANMLPERSDYVVTTSEFDDMRARVMALTDGRCPRDEGKPTLRRGAARCHEESDVPGRPTLRQKPQ